MNIALASMFRQAERRIPPYFERVSALRDALEERGQHLRLIIAEGDSWDNTYLMLQDHIQQYGLDADLFKREHHGPYWGSIDVPERWNALAWVCNGILERVRDTDDVVIYVECDLEWTVETMLGLLDDLKEKPAVAPLVFHAEGWFWDSCGYRVAENTTLTSWVPNGYTKMYSVGSCCVMLADVARKCRFAGPINHWVAFCQDMWRNNYGIWLDSRYSITHPI